MIWRIRELLDGGADLVRAEIDLAAQRMRQGVAAGILLVAAIGVGLIGLAVVLTGVIIAVADAIGLIGGLLAVGLVLLAMGVGAAWPIVARLNAATEPAPNPRRRAAASKRQMSDAVDLSVSKREAEQRSRADHATGAPKASGGPARAGGPGERPGARPGAEKGAEKGSESPAHAAAEFVARHPMAVAGGAFLALSAVGPYRSVRLISRGIALASFASTVIDALKEEPAHEGNGRAGSEPSRPRARTGPQPGEKPARAPRPEPSARTDAGAHAGPPGRPPPGEPKVPTRPPRFQVD